jgi:hypothetical protein
MQSTESRIAVAKRENAGETSINREIRGVSQENT